MARMLTLLLVLGLATVTAAQGTQSPREMDLVAQAVTTRLTDAPDAPAYVGGRGLITDELVTGMFLNPTSGTLAKYEATLQYCALIFKVGHDTAVGHGAIAGFGVTDWIEIGAGGLFVDVPGGGDNPHVAGPYGRIRVLKDESWWPELSVGGIVLLGDEALEKQTVFIAASKGIRFDTRFIRGARAHVGFRQAWVEVGEDGSFGFVGGELELPRHIFLVAEVSNESGAADRIPWAAGVQVRHPDGFGFTLAAVQTGTLKNLAVYVGVGINFQ